MNRSVVYITNEHPFYLRMALTSMGMLRNHNKDIPVRIFLVRDQSSQTIERENVSKHTSINVESTDQFIETCKSIDVEVLDRPPLIYPGEESFFHINRKYFAELKEDHILYLDADTFIFGDVEDIFDHHEFVDFAACEAMWARRRGWNPGFLPVPVGPFSSGVMLWNNGTIRDWCDLLPRYMADFRKNESTLANWLRTLHSDCLLREEFSVTRHVCMAGLVHSFIEKEDCHLIESEQDIDDLGKSLIFHSYTPNWKKCYAKLYPKKVGKMKLVLARPNS
jgi:hypothetical protein